MEVSLHHCLYVLMDRLCGVKDVSGSTQVKVACGKGATFIKNHAEQSRGKNRDITWSDAWASHLVPRANGTELAKRLSAGERTLEGEGYVIVLNDISMLQMSYAMIWVDIAIKSTYGLQAILSTRPAQHAEIILQFLSIDHEGSFLVSVPLT